MAHINLEYCRYRPPTQTLKPLSEASYETNQRILNNAMDSGDYDRFNSTFGSMLRSIEYEHAKLTGMM